MADLTVFTLKQEAGYFARVASEYREPILYGVTDGKAVGIEFGDFQTPEALATSVCCLIKSLGISPRSVVEPTCGQGSFLRAAAERFPNLHDVIAADINVDHLKRAREACTSFRQDINLQIEQGDFFAIDWMTVVKDLEEPILLLGNPPWVTNSELSAMHSGNLPLKKNLDKLRGIEALTGSSNFDISEWMLREYLTWLQGRIGVIAVLCKTSVARRLLQWSHRSPAHSLHGRRPADPAL